MGARNTREVRENQMILGGFGNKEKFGYKTMMMREKRRSNVCEGEFGE